MIPKKERYDFAKSKFLESNLHLQKHLEQLNPVVADHLGITLEEYRKHEIDSAFSDYAKKLNIDISNLVIELCAKNEQEKLSMLTEDHKEIAECIGVDWKEYCELNRLPMEDDLVR